jgi:hypothetical protein
MLKSDFFASSHRLQLAATIGPPVRRGELDSDAVRRVQLALTHLGFPLPLSFRDGGPDGIFGAETYAALVAFQKRSFPMQSGEWDGVAGSKTLGQLDSRLSTAPDPAILLLAAEELPPLLQSDLSRWNPSPTSCVGLSHEKAAFLARQRMSLAQLNSPSTAISFASTAPTVVCDGAGGYTVDLKASQMSPFASCLKAHEESHAAELRKLCPDFCKGKPYGHDQPLVGQCPAFPDKKAFWTWRRSSEIKAYEIEEKCVEALLKKEKAGSSRHALFRARLFAIDKSLNYWKNVFQIP